jgi:uncharacterized protein (DUF58 family)
MKKNMGKVDRIIRAIIGLAIIATGIIYQSWWGIIGIVPLLTAFMGSCPAYLPLKISTMKKKEVS